MSKHITKSKHKLRFLNIPVDEKLDDEVEKAVGDGYVSKADFVRDAIREKAAARHGK